MDASATGLIVLVPFPFSDLSSAKLRPALVLASDLAAARFKAARETATRDKVVNDVISVTSLVQSACVSLLLALFQGLPLVTLQVNSA